MLLLNVGCFLFCLHFNGSFLTTLSVSHTACSVAGPGHWDSERYLERVSGREWRAQYISDEFSSLPKQDCLHSEPSLPRSLIPHTFPKRFLASTTWLGFTGTEINKAELQYLKKKKKETQSEEGANNLVSNECLGEVMLIPGRLGQVLWLKKY